jgi:hypothetical protein
MFNFPVDYSKIVMLDVVTMPVAVYTFPIDVKGLIFSNTSGSDQYPQISFYKPSSKSGSIQAQAINTIIIKNGTTLYLPIKPYQYTGQFGPGTSGFQIYQLY